MNKFPLNNKKILIVDDARPPRKVLIKLLSDLGKITFLEAESIKEAKSILDKQNISLIFCDHQLQDSTSTNLLSWLKDNKNGLNHKTPVIVVSSDLDKNTILADRNLGALNFLVKPFNFSDLFHVLANGLGWDEDILDDL